MIKKYKLLCSSCHYIKEVSYEDLFDRECPLCGKEMKYDINTATQEVKTEDFVDDVIVSTMEKELKALGNQKCYEIIEHLAEARTRARYRKYFLLAGGFIPESEIKEEI